MTEQRTGFCRFDGHRIAFATVGTGPALVLPAWWVSNIAEDWKEERFRRFIGALAQGKQVIRYDRLGCGMSDRGRPRETMGLDYEVGTLEALIDHLGLERLSLLGGSYGGCAAVAYAAHDPGRVDRVMLYGSFASGKDLVPEHAREAMLHLVRTHWGLGSQVLADVFVPSGGLHERESFARWQRASAGAAFAADLLEVIFDVDIRELASGLELPVLVIHRRGDRVIRLRAGEQLAALILGAELVVLDGDAHMPWHGDMESVLGAAAPFLGITPPPVARRAVDVDALSPRERDVLSLVAEGLSDSEIAERLVLSPHTVHRHVSSILRKLGLHSRAAAAAQAARAGLV